jgi:preprotein translocase subunit SecY
VQQSSSSTGSAPVRTSSPLITRVLATIFILVVVFTFFYTLVIYQQQNLAENLRRTAASSGIRPGRLTAEYIMRVLVRITWAGARSWAPSRSCRTS